MRAILGILAAGCVAGGLFFARPAQTPGPPMRDFEAYYSAGNVWNAGGDPYSAALWPAERALPGVRANRFEALPFAGPPVLLPLLGTIAHVPFAIANDLWRALLAAAAIVLAAMAAYAARAPRTARTFILFALAELGFGPITSAFALGQLALPAAACAALALRWKWTAVLAWIQPNVALCTAALRIFVPALLVFAACLVAVATPAGALHYWTVLRAHAAAERFALIQVTPAAVAYGFGSGGAAAIAIGATIAAAVLAAWFSFVRSIESGTLRLCATCALTPLVLPFAHEHDLSVAFLPAAVLVVRAGPRMAPAAVFAALLVAADWLGLAQRPQGALQTLLLVTGCGCALLALAENARVRTLAAVASAAALIVICSRGAPPRQVPVWPDAMHALPANAAQLPIAAAWSRELRSTGLLEPDPYAAALRALSLAGCAMLAVLTVRYAREAPP